MSKGSILELFEKRLVEGWFIDIGFVCIASLVIRRLPRRAMTIVLGIGTRAILMCVSILVFVH